MYKRFIIITAAVLAGSTVWAKNIFNCDFEPGKWDKNDFIEVKSSRWENVNTFRQEKSHIVNVCPENATKLDLLSKRAPETYAAMIWKTPIKGNNVTIKSTMSFDYRMAPSIVIAEKPGVSSKGFPEFRTHYEIVLFDQGLNVWRHWFKDGKQVWRRVGFLPVKILPKVKYELEVEVKRTLTGTILEVSVADREMIVKDINLDNEYYAGIIGCEGINRFYDFEIDK